MPYNLLSVLFHMVFFCYLKFFFQNFSSSFSWHIQIHTIVLYKLMLKKQIIGPEDKRLRYNTYLNNQIE